MLLGTFGDFSAQTSCDEFELQSRQNYCLEGFRGVCRFIKQRTPAGARFQFSANALSLVMRAQCTDEHDNQLIDPNFMSLTMSQPPAMALHCRRWPFDIVNNRASSLFNNRVHFGAEWTQSRLFLSPLLPSPPTRVLAFQCSRHRLFVV
jgi:hypothetical protein